MVRGWRACAELAYSGGGQAFVNNNVFNKRARLWQVVRHLRAHQCISIDAKRLLEPDRHLCRVWAVAIEETAQCLAGDVEAGREVIDADTARVDNRTPQPVAGMNCQRGVHT